LRPTGSIVVSSRRRVNSTRIDRCARCRTNEIPRSLAVRMRGIRYSIRYASALAFSASYSAWVMAPESRSFLADSISELGDAPATSRM